MLQLRLESANDSIDLAGIEHDGYGVQIGPGATGVGLPSYDTRWLEGAGDGSRFRGARALSRDSDYKFQVLGRDRDDLISYVRRLAMMLSPQQDSSGNIVPTRLLWSEGRDEEWYQEVVRVGGGDWNYGLDTDGENFLVTVVTLRSGDPYFTSTLTQSRTIEDQVERGLLSGPLTGLSLSSAQAIGAIDLDNTSSDAPAYPIWTIYGPGSDFSAVRADGAALHWNGTIAAGDWLKIDTRRGTAVDNHGVNRYGSFAARPRMWSIPQGFTTASATMTDTTPGQSKIVCTWQARRMVMI